MSKIRKSTELKVKSEVVKSVEMPTLKNNRAINVFVLCIILAIVTIAAFWGIQKNSFLNMDDDVYVTGNDRVQKGVSLENIKWAFSSLYFGFYYPLTWLSHMIDCEIYGLNAGGHHITSLIIHIINALLLFYGLHRMTKYRWRSFIVAVLFAIHPLHVEPVAWVSERKELLSTFFLFVGIIFYSLYVEKPTINKYILVFLSYLLGLMSKPMIITFPFILLLLDYWPLERWNPFKGKEVKESDKKGREKKLTYLIVEKIPLFLLVPIFSFLTIYAQKNAHAVVPVSEYPLAKRIANAIVSYCEYLRKMVLPNDLTAYYPIRRGNILFGITFLCLAIIIAITIAIIFYARKKRYLLFGWLFYIGTLIPVIGIVRVGDQGMADRYTYVPLVGIFIAIVFLVGEISKNDRVVKNVFSVGTAVVIVVFIFVTRFYCGLWRNEDTLFKWALKKTENNWFAANNLGSYLFHNGKMEEGVYYINEALKVNSKNANSHINLGYYLGEKGKYEEAIEHFRKAVEIDPKSVKGWDNLGLALAKRNKLDEAIECLEKAKELDPSFFDTYFDLGYAYYLKGKYDDAIKAYSEALRIDPKSAKTLNEIGATLMDLGRLDEAERNFNEALKIDPNFYEAKINLALLYTKEERLDRAEQEYENILKIKTPSVEILNNYGLLLMKMGKNDEAEETFKKAIENTPKYANSYINLGVLYANDGRYEKAKEFFKKALQIDPNSEIATSNLKRAERLLNER